MKLLRKRDAEAILERLDRLTQEEARLIAAHTLEVVHNLKVAIDGVYEFLWVYSTSVRRSTSELVVIDAERVPTGDQVQEKIRYWLSPPDPSTNHNIARRDHHDGTATWFTQGRTFEQWKAVGSLLWIHGKRMCLFYLLFISCPHWRTDRSGFREEHLMVSHAPTPLI
jgi:hypothetical protein